MPRSSATSATSLGDVLNALESKGLLAQARTIICGDVRVDLAGDAAGPLKRDDNAPEALKKRFNALMYGASGAEE